VGKEPENLPLLEFALTRLWDKQQNRELTHAAYSEIGGVKQALADHAETIYSRLTAKEDAYQCTKRLNKKLQDLSTYAYAAQ
jgi:hypothetical protein